MSHLKNFVQILFRFCTKSRFNNIINLLNIFPDSGTEVSLTVLQTNTGKMRIVHNGFVYIKHRITRDNRFIQWRCVMCTQNTQCKARLTTPLSDCSLGTITNDFHNHTKDRYAWQKLLPVHTFNYTEFVEKN